MNDIEKIENTELHELNDAEETVVEALEQTRELTPELLKRIIEGALFAASEPLSVARLLTLFDEAAFAQRPELRQEIKDILQIIQQEYAERGAELKELASGWQFQVTQDLAPWIRKLWQDRTPRYSRALMETLALVAYKQPITRAEIEQVRGVAVSTHIVKTLEEHGWIKEVGHKDVAGKPALFATTKQFLDHFGMKSLSELPSLEDLRDLDKMGDQLQEQLALAEINSDTSVEVVQEHQLENNETDLLDEEIEEQLAEEEIVEDTAVEEDAAEEILELEGELTDK